MSDWIRTEEPSPGVRLLRMEAPRGNALSTETMKAMARAFYDIDKSDARAAVLVGKGRVFGAGVDLVFAHGLGRTEVADFVDAFEALFLQLFSLRVPIVAALNGVALAGGAVLASACDWRIASAEGPFEFGFIEPELGISLPSAALEIAKTAVPAEYWTEAIILGKRYDLAQAQQRRIVHEVADDVVAAACARAAAFGKNGVHATAKLKSDLRHDPLTRARARAIESRRIFLEEWFSEEGVSRRAAVVERLKTKA